MCSWVDYIGTHKGCLLIEQVPTEVWIDAMVDYDLDEKLIQHKIVTRNYLDQLKLPANYKIDFKIGDIVVHKQDESDSEIIAKIMDIDKHEYAPQLSPEIRLSIKEDKNWIDIGYKCVNSIKGIRNKNILNITVEAQILRNLERARVCFTIHCFCARITPDILINFVYV